MRRELAFSCLVIIVLLSSVGFARKGQEENAPDKLIRAARLLEEKPFAKDSKDLRAWALKWVIETDKVSVKVCSLLISGIDKKYKYSGEVFGQYTIGMAAFKLSEPDKATDEDAAQFAGIKSALTSYEAMVKEQPKARNSFMDDLLTKRGDGSLSSYVAENNCKEKK